MAASVEKDGYTAELTEDGLELVYRNPKGRKLKTVPAQLAGDPGLISLIAMGKALRAHRKACQEYAQAWAEAGTGAPRALAEADPEWRRALEDACVALTEERGEDGLFARTYAGPHGLTLTQLLPEDVVPYRDLLMGEDAWLPDGLFTTGIPHGAPDHDGQLPFPERVLAAHPQQQRLALEKIRALQHETLDWEYVFKKDMDRVLAGLEETAPALAVTLLDEMADFALQQGSEAEAAAWFGRARKTERNLGRTPDHAWLHSRQLRYAAAGALSATVLRAWVNELATGGSGSGEHLARFREVVRARLRGHGELHPQLAADIRKLAKAAGQDPDEELATMMAELIEDGALSLDDTEFWTRCCKGRAIDILVGRRAEAVREAVLRLRPRGYASEGRAELWRTLLERTGALAQLTGELPGLERGAAAAWLTDCVNTAPVRDSGPWPMVYELAERVAPRAAADGVPVEFRHWTYRNWRERKRIPLDLMDLLLEHGVAVSDPPERLATARPYDLLVSRRPELRHLLADARFEREVRAWMRADLDMTVEGDKAADAMSSNRWYNPHQTKGWGRIDHLYATWVGHEELRAWCARERALLRAGVDFDGLVLILGRFVHVGGVVDQLLQDPEAAREFAAVDVIGLLMRELPPQLDRERIEKIVAKVKPEHLSPGDGARGDNFVLLRDELPELAQGTTWQEAGLSFHRVTHLLVMAANCLEGQARLVRRFTPDAERAPAPAPAPEEETSWRSLAQRLMRLAVSETPPWDGDLRKGSQERDHAWQRLRVAPVHGYALLEALRAAMGLTRDASKTVAELAQYADCPFASGEWRIVEYALPTATERQLPALYTWPIRTGTSAALVLRERRTGSAVRKLVPLRVLEYAPGGDFPAAGPLAAAGLEPVRADVLEPARPASWFTRFAQSYQQHGAAPARPELAADLAGRLDLSLPEAVILLRGVLPCAPHQGAAQSLLSTAGSYGLKSWEVTEKEHERALDGLHHFLTPGQLAALYDRLLPDDPELLWTQGPDVPRAAEWWLREIGRPLPAPPGLTALAHKEVAQPTGESATPRRRHENEPRTGTADRLWWPPLRRSALLGRLAAGADCLQPGIPLSPEPELLALPRLATWAAYRTPAGDPLRPVLGAAISRLRRELAAGPGPLRVFSLQSNYLMGAPPSPDGLTAHPAVTVTEDDNHDVRHVSVDPDRLSGADDPVLEALDTYLDSVLPSQWLPTPSGLPALADLRLLLSEDFAALGAHLAADAEVPAGWEQHPARSAPRLVTRCAEQYGLSEDAAALHLMLLALPDPTDRKVKEWTGWKPARFKEAAAQLGATPLVSRAARSRAGRGLFVPGLWHERTSPRLPLEAVKLPHLPQAANHRSTSHVAVVPSMPVPVLFERRLEGLAG
ncbi:hypothetical protein [Streptomyces sp. 891-h]|uniref:hypothetical protein n=1 Tax=Streptomyces sp. 891-h TaxID=2720714 RepID=UPI001FAA6AEA|nr:hypothetical protein [Streptomyces sp. 891-h]UNZ18798.1 hypothetical protein HC362_18895 [Streptomyces sp. 891-h]